MDVLAPFFSVFCRSDDSSTGSPVHVLVSIQAVRVLPHLCVVNVTTTVLFSALTLLFGRLEGHPVCKKLSCGVPAWLSVWSEVQNLHMAQLMPLPLTVSCFSKIQIGFYRAMLCIRDTSHGPVSVRLSVRLSVCLSVTSRCSTKTTKCRITQTTPHQGI